MGQNSNSNIDRDQQILSRLAEIQRQVNSIDGTLAFSLRANADEHESVLRKIFGTSKRRAQIYLAADGARGVQEIADHIRMKRPNVSTELSLLKSEGLLEIIDNQGGRDIYVKKSIDSSFRISKFLQREFSLKKDGSLAD